MFALALPVAPAPLAPAAANEAGGAYACRQPTHTRIPDVPPGHAHVPGMVETPAGDLLLHFDGDPLLGPDNHGRGWGITRTFTTRLKPGDREWPHPDYIRYDDPDAAHNTVLFNDGEGRIHNFFTTRRGPNHVHSTLDYRYSDDDGHTWSDPVELREEWGWMFGNRPFRMSNGEAIVPVYKEGAPWGVGFFISGDNFETYEVHPPGELPWPGAIVGGLQAATVEVEPGHLLAYLRTNARFIYETRSFDYGRTWTPAAPTRFPNPWARVDLLKLDSGNLLLAYNPSSSQRTPLRLALSQDGGLTWPYEVDVEDGPDARYSYPFLFQASDESIHMGYSLREGVTIGHLVFNEEFVRSGPDLPSDPAGDLGRIEYRDGEARHVETCAYAWAQGIPGHQQPYACRQDIHPQDPDFPGVHVATLTEAANGDVLYGFYAGTAEKADDVGTYMSRLAVGQSTWTRPEVIFDEPDKPDGNAVLWTNDRTGRLYLFFSTIMGGGWTEATLRMITSDDHGETWSEPQYIREEWGWLFGTRPFRMTNGEVIVPIYSETVWSSGWYISDDDFETWQSHPQTHEALWPRSYPLGGIQPATVEIEPGHLVAYMRSRDLDRRIYKTESLDYGRTWLPATATSLPNNNSRVDLIKLDSGNLLLAYNATTSGRSPLRLALSEDGGETWPYWVDVEREQGREFSYPYLIQGSDGMIHLGYTHRRQSMRHVVFNEEFVRRGAELPSNPSFDVKLEYRDGALHDVDVCAYSPAEPTPEQSWDAGPYACRQDVFPHDPSREPGFSHVAGLVEAPSGDLLYTFDGDKFLPDPHREGWGLKRTYISRMRSGEGNWSYPDEILYDDPDSTHNTVLFNDGQRIHNFFTTRRGPSHSQSTLDYRYSDDDGHTWSDPVELRAEFGWMFGNRPFRMSNGEAIVPIYRENTPNGAGFMISADNFETYEVHPFDEVLWPKFVIQPATVELDQPGHLLTFLRGNLGRVYQSRSFDYGRTWTPTAPTNLPNPWSRVDLLELDSGNLLVAYHDNTSSRTPLVLALSEDGGLTWPHSVRVETDPSRSFSYPYFLQTSDGALHLGYSHGGSTMRHLVFNEAFVRSGADLESNADFVKLEYRGDGLEEVEECTYSKG